MSDIIYPKQCLLSSPTLPSEEYKKYFPESLFMFYAGLISLEKSSKYYIDLNIVDLHEKVPVVEKTFFFNDIENNYEIVLNSVSVMLEPYKKNILNFEDKGYEREDYLDIVNNWMDSIKNEV